MAKAFELPARGKLARKKQGEVNLIIRNGVIMKRQPRMQTIPQPILEKSSSPAIMDLNEEYA